MEKETKIRDSQRGLEGFTERTGLPTIATLQELKDYGGRYFASEPIMMNGKPSRIEYVFLDPDGTERQTYVWKRFNETGDFVIHLETETRMKY